MKWKRLKRCEERKTVKAFLKDEFLVTAESMTDARTRYLVRTKTKTRCGRVGVEAGAPVELIFCVQPSSLGGRFSRDDARRKTRDEKQTILTPPFRATGITLWIELPTAVGLLCYTS